MAEHTDQLTRDRSESTGGVRGRVGRGVRDRVGGLFSVRAFLASLLVLTAGLLAGGPALSAVPVVGGLLGTVGGLVGMATASFLLGLAGGRIVEVGAAGGVVAALSLLLWKPVLSLAFGLGVPVAVVGVGSGLLVAGIGAYLGADLRDGLTREL